MLGEDHGTTFCYDAMGRRILRQDDDQTWTRYFYDGLNVLLERGATTNPSTWGADFIGDDLEDGNVGEWWTWSATPTTMTNVWDHLRRSRVIETSESVANATRAFVGDDAWTNSPNDTPWNAARRAFSVALRRHETGDMRVGFTISTTTGDVAMSYISWGSGGQSLRRGPPDRSATPAPPPAGSVRDRGGVRGQVLRLPPPPRLEAPPGGDEVAEGAGRGCGMTSPPQGDPGSRTTGGLI